MINDQVGAELSSNFRVLHGRLYSALLSQFGVKYIDDIEDVIQNTFLKALKTWKPGKIPEKKESWLFIVAKNEMINYIKSLESKRNAALESDQLEEAESTLRDLRLETILFISDQEELSIKAKTILILKNVFGLHVKEICNTTLISEEAIHKLVNRTNKKLQGIDRDSFELDQEVSEEKVRVVVDILYAVFAIGFDSFDTKANKIVNDDLCLEALSLARLLTQRHPTDVCSNLIALFCFHISRIPAKVDNGELVSFQKQDREKWDRDLINLGFKYLRKPQVLHPFYLEALITSRHMSTVDFTTNHWKEIVKLYKLWSLISDSPLIKLNMAYSLFLAGELTESQELLTALEEALPENHFYLDMVKAEMLKENSPADYEKIIRSKVNDLDHELRRDFLMKKLND